MNQDSPFETWRLANLKQVAVSPEILELLALAFEGGRLSKREWVGLTKAEAKEISMVHRPYVIDMIASLEARLKEKNT